MRYLSWAEFGCWLNYSDIKLVKVADEWTYEKGRTEFLELMELFLLKSRPVNRSSKKYKRRRKR